MNVKSRITKLESKTGSHNSIIFIDAKSSEDFRQQIRSLIEDGLDPEGRKFVYVEDPLQRLYKQITAASDGLVQDCNPRIG